MTARDLIIFIVGSPDIENEAGVFQPQQALILLNNKRYELSKVWVSGDNKLIFEASK